MKVLVTGGGGYIGSVLTPALLAAGHEVTVLDSFIYGAASLLDCCIDPKLTVVRGDARDERLVAELVPKADAVLPLACLTGAPLCDRDPMAARTVNLDAVLLALKRRSKSQLVVYPTTNSGYGIGQKDSFCDESTPLKPISLYGRLKVDAENAVLEAGNSVTLRLATAFGLSPRMRLDLLVNDFVYRAATDRFVILFESHFKRNYIHVRDIARAFLHALDGKLPAGPYNVGLSDANLSKKELCDRIRRYVPEFHVMESPIGQDPDKRDYIVSNAKIEAAGFRPRFSLDDGIQELVKGYRIIRRNQYSNV